MKDDDIIQEDNESTNEGEDYSALERVFYEPSSF